VVGRVGIIAGRIDIVGGGRLENNWCENEDQVVIRSIGYDGLEPSLSGIVHHCDAVKCVGKR